MKYSRPRGTKDILPGEIELWQKIESACRIIFSLYGYDEIRTPIFEETDLFNRGIGRATDIVAKEMYTFEDKGNRSLTLRPEATAAVVRAALENNLLIPENVLKLYYIGPMFRYERPQAGRYRQFYQAGVEVFGSKDPRLDAEVIILSVQLLVSLGLKDITAQINNVGCDKCQPNYRKALQDYFKDNLKHMCKDCAERYKKNILRIMDCKQEKCQKYINQAPMLSGQLCDNCRIELSTVEDILSKYGVPYTINQRLVRGLDYYSGVIFEIISKDLGAQNAVCGGGRYDMLVQELGGKSTPACGFAIGMDRLTDLLKKALPEGVGKKSRIFIASIGEEAQQKAFELAQQLRAKGIGVEIDYMQKSLKAQLKRADRINASKVLIIGENEIKNKTILLKDMYDGTQKEVLCDATEIAAIFA